MKKLFLVNFSLFLAACAGNPASYLPSGKTPIINLEADVAQKLDISALHSAIRVKNRTNQALNARYKVIWYDAQGTTKAEDPWQSVVLNAEEDRQILLNKPNAESENYRFYLSSER